MLVLQLLLMLLALHKAHPFPRSRIIMSPIAIKAGSIAARRTSLLHVQFLSKLCSPLSLSTRPEDATGTNIEANGSTAFIHSNEYRYSDKPKVVFVLGGRWSSISHLRDLLSCHVLIFDLAFMTMF